MKEFSSDELVHLLVNKVKELKVEKEKSDELNAKLENNMAKLEETQQELAKQRDMLQDVVRQKTEELLKVERLSAIGQLSARVAHDLRNPLTVIQTSSRILRVKLESKLDIKSQQQWERLDRAINRMSHQLDDVMDYVRAPLLKKKNYSLSLIVQDVIERIDVPNNVGIHPPQKDHMVFCDPEKMEIVFVNLIVNSIQAIGEKKGDIIIDITGEPSNNKFVVIKVIDNGCGISEEIVDKIFEPLFTTKQVGTGLGLSSCKSIIEQHGGTICVFSKVGKGATFTIKIPKKSDWDEISKGAHEKIAWLPQSPVVKKTPL
jgi:signal transduction histidine kinase